MLSKRQIKNLDDLVSAKIKETQPICFMGNHLTQDPHHVIPRRHLATRFDMDNIVGLCRECHTKVHSDVEFMQQFSDIFDRRRPAVYERLVEKSRCLGKYLDYETIKGEIENA